MAYRTLHIHLASWTLLLVVGVLTSCSSPNDKDDNPAPLTGRWLLVSQHTTNTDATTGQIVTEQHLAGTQSDYLEISETMFNEYRANMLYFTTGYTRNGNTLAMQGSTRTDYSREITELTSKKLVLHYKLPAIVMNQAVTIDATYSR